jgi:hypothetical protein
MLNEPERDEPEPDWAPDDMPGEDIHPPVPESAGEG